MSTRPFVYLHACAVVPDCDCGDREWVVEPPSGQMFTTDSGVGTFGTMAEAHKAAAAMRPGVDYVPLPPARMPRLNPPLTLEALRVVFAE